MAEEIPLGCENIRLAAARGGQTTPLIQVPGKAPAFGFVWVRIWGH